jgi:magnesium-transporting ATPase (P-type)
MKWQVLREGKWVSILSEELLPGDLCLLTSRADTPCPADILLISGQVVVNEALLTGESTPQIKDQIDTVRSDPATKLSLVLSSFFAILPCDLLPSSSHYVFPRRRMREKRTSPSICVENTAITSSSEGLKSSNTHRPERRECLSSPTTRVLAMSSEQVLFFFSLPHSHFSLEISFVSSLHSFFTISF